MLFIAPSLGLTAVLIGAVLPSLLLIYGFTRFYAARAKFLRLQKAGSVGTPYTSIAVSWACANVSNLSTGSSIRLQFSLGPFGSHSVFEKPTSA